MNRNLLLLSASAAICLLWPAVSLAEPQHDARPAQGGHAQTAHATGRSAPRATTTRSYTTRTTTTRTYSGHGYATSARHAYRHAGHSQTHVAQGGASAASHGQAIAANAATHDAAAVQGTTKHPELNHNIQATHTFQAGAYRQPAGYEQRHWGFGERLPSAYYARDYWLTDFALYGLFGPPEGLVWVRVGPDALLIDQFTGDIVQVDYGVFY